PGRRPGHGIPPRAARALGRPDALPRRGARAGRRDLLHAADAAVHAALQLAARDVALRRRSRLARPAGAVAGAAPRAPARSDPPGEAALGPRPPEHRRGEGLDAAAAGDE